jgi:hypothetical protein
MTGNAFCGRDELVKIDLEPKEAPRIVLQVELNKRFRILQVRLGNTSSSENGDYPSQRCHPLFHLLSELSLNVFRSIEILERRLATE